MDLNSTTTGSDDAKVALVCAADDGFAMQLAVTIKSVLLNLDPARRLELYILDGGISTVNRSKIERSLGPDRVTVSWIRPAIPDELVVSGHITKTAYFRLWIPEVLPGSVTKVIYLDSDLLVLGDLGKLWDSELHDKYCLAAQDTAAPFMDAAIGFPKYRDGAGLLACRCPVRNYHELGIPGSAKYFNSGVLVLDLGKWRDAGITEQLRRCLQDHAQHVLWWDQYALNVVLAGKWGELDPQWNMQSSLFVYSTAASSLMGAAAYLRVISAPRIVHFSSVPKPWHFASQHPQRDLFFRYLDETAWAGWRPQPPPRDLRKTLSITLKNHGVVGLILRTSGLALRFLGTQLISWANRMRPFRLLTNKIRPLGQNPTRDNQSRKSA